MTDRKGNPIATLAKEDFVVKEDGAEQVITTFEPYTFEARSPGPVVLVPGRSSTNDPKTLSRRVFLIALQHAWLPTARFKVVDELIAFLRHRTLPQDYVAISAWDRVTDFTTDHEGLAVLVERLRALQASLGPSESVISALLRYHDDRLWAQLDPALDGIFGSTSTGKKVPPLPAAEFSHILNSIRLSAAAGGGGVGGERSAQGAVGNALDILGNIQLLRFIEGEKHLIYPIAAGGRLPSADDDRSIARVASDARVAIHMIRAEGLAPTAPLRFIETEMSLKNIAAQSGGSAFIDRDPELALRQIDANTRTGYLLAYSPTDQNMDGHHRRINVEIRRPKDAIVTARQSYVASAVPATYDGALFAAQDQVMNLAERDKAVAGFGLTATARHDVRAVLVDIAIDLQKVQSTLLEGKRTGKLEVAVFCSDRAQRLVGEQWATFVWEFRPETFDRVVKEGLRQRIPVPISGPVHWAKVVVYDYGSGASASVTTLVK